MVTPSFAPAVKGLMLYLGSLNKIRKRWALRMSCPHEIGYIKPPRLYYIGALRVKKDDILPMRRKNRKRCSYNIIEV